MAYILRARDITIAYFVCVVSTSSLLTSDVATARSSIFYHQQKKSSVGLENTKSPSSVFATVSSTLPSMKSTTTPSMSNSSFASMYKSSTSNIDYIYISPDKIYHLFKCCWHIVALRIDNHSTHDICGCLQKTYYNTLSARGKS